MTGVATDPEEIYQLLRFGTPEERQGFARTLPPSPFLEASIPLLGSDRPGQIIVMLAPSIISYCAGSQPAIGAPLAFAAHRYSVELYETTTDHGLLPTTLSGLASSYANACNLLGRSDDVIAFVNEYELFYERMPEPINLRSLKLSRVAALLNVNRLDEAAAFLEDSTLPGNYATDIELHRLQKLLARLRGDVTTDRNAPGPEDNFPQLAKYALGQAVAGLPAGVELRDLVDKLDLDNRVDPSTPEGLSMLIDTLKVGREKLTRGTRSDNDITIRQRIFEASSIFITPQPARQQIENSEAELRHCLDWGRRQQVADIQTDALWGIYLCRSRSNDPSGAADALLELRAFLEETRSAIREPLKRGGAFSTYPHLFPALCEKLYTAGRTSEMLEAIEANKGRGIADLLTERGGTPVNDADIYGAVRRIPELCVTHDFHYVTYLVDQDRTYVVLVHKNGTIYVPDPIALSRQAIRDAAAKVEPHDANFDASRELAPLLAWIGPLIESATVAQDDHLCIAADDDLANVPFAYLKLGKRRVADLVSITRVQNAFHLAHILDAKATRPSEYLGVAVPARENVASPTWQKFRAALYAPLEYLATKLSGRIIENEGASAAALQKQPLDHLVIHFSTHGLFPSPDEAKKTPFSDAGLLLADGKSLPRLSPVSSTVLTPRYILETELDLTGSHVSMMACVSGLSREGIGGDALGMEWALIQAGAASVLSTHWEVQADSAGDFLTAFYRFWVERQLSRRDALRATIHELRRKGGASGEIESWAAFSLTGDWR